MIADEVLAMFELSNDLLFGKIPETKYRYYVEESLRLGREAAMRLQGITRAEASELDQPAAASRLSGQSAAGGQSGSVTIFRLYKEAGIKIICQETSKSSCGVSFRAQSEFGKDGSGEVMIYKQSIAELADHSRMAPLWEETETDGNAGENSRPCTGLEIGADQALEVYLSHEYFHYLEYHSGEIKDEKTMRYYDRGAVSDTVEPVELTRIFGWKRKAGILRCSEIAAHAFAKQLTGIAVLPNYYDYTYLIAEGRVRREDFVRKMKQYETMLNNAVSVQEF